MNIENIKQAIELVKNLKPEQFDMSDWRSHKHKAIICNTVGCIVGHCTKLDVENIRNNFIDDGYINFGAWSREFFGVDGVKWSYMFDGEWADSSITNTPEHAVYRMQRIVDGYYPFSLSVEFYNETMK